MSVIAATAVPASIAAASIAKSTALTPKQKVMVAGGAVGGGLLSVGFVTMVNKHIRKKEQRTRQRILAELGIRDAVMNAARNLDPENAAFNLKDVEALLDSKNAELMDAIATGNQKAIEDVLRRYLHIDPESEENDTPPEDDKGPKK